jgi:hypothetical protein
MTALKGPSTAASGWWGVDERRADPDVDTAVRQRRAAEELDPHVQRPGRLDVLLAEPSIPSTSTQSSGTREPNATVARIAIFAAASPPPTSSVGSASA